MSSKLFLSSSSPRRKDLLAQLNLSAEVVIAPVEEVSLPNESPESFVIRMAVEKAMSGYDKLAGDDIYVIGGDTLVVLDDKSLGKPKNKLVAKKMLSLLSNKTHRVISAVAVVHAGEVFFDKCITKVKFTNLSEQEIEYYLESSESMDKAGSYAIQGLGARYVEKIEGSYSAVMGLPLFELNKLLNKAGFYGE